MWNRSRFRVTAQAWLWLAVACSLLPLIRGFSRTEVFFVRDLGFFFWPRHLWLKSAWGAGQWPLWDSYAGGGQSAVSDPLNQYFLLPVTALRLLLPNVPGFNLWVAAPFPLLALGGWLWLRRRVSAPAAFVGASVLAVAGPVVSTALYPNFSWSVAVIPWALWAAERLCEQRTTGRFVTLGLLVAFQALAGEAVSFAATTALLIGVAVTIPAGNLMRARVSRAAVVLSAVAVGVMLSAVQTVPLLVAAARSTRAGDFQNLYWSAHPLALLETITGHLFGHPHDGRAGQPWMLAMNEQREPLLYSLYIGVAALVLASVGRADREDRRWRWFWIVVAGVSMVAALGQYTSIYPGLEALVPPLRSFRFPVKYLIFAVVAVAALAASGTEALKTHVEGRHPMQRPLAVTVCLALAALSSLCVAALTIAGGPLSQTLWAGVADLAGVQSTGEAARWMISSSGPLWLRLCALLIGSLIFLSACWQRHRFGVGAAYCLAVLAVIDPLAINFDLNPTIAAGHLGPPAWSSAARGGDDRVYVGGVIVRRGASETTPADIVDGRERYDLPIDVSRQEAVARLLAQFALTPSAWGMRQIITTDVPQLWPSEYNVMLKTFRAASREDRFRFLARAGVRYCYLPEPPREGTPPLTVPSEFEGGMQLYECGPAVSRAFVTTDAVVEPSIERQIELMFDARHDPAAAVLLEAEPPPAAGDPSASAGAPRAVVQGGNPTSLTVAADAGVRGGYLNVLDSFDPDWTVSVDGAPAALLRANGLFRAVRLGPGAHVVRFTYRPRALYVGMVLSGIGGLVLLLPLVGVGRLAPFSSARRVDSASRAPYDALHEHR